MEPAQMSQPLHLNLQPIDCTMFSAKLGQTLVASGARNLPVQYSTETLSIGPMPHPSDLDAVFSALADPTRRAILSMLLEDDMAVSDVAEPFGISLAAISKHLGILAAARLIQQERRGRITWCKLDPEGMSGAMVWMRAFGQIDPLDLDDFERFLATELEADTLHPEK